MYAPDYIVYPYCNLKEYERYIRGFNDPFTEALIHSYEMNNLNPISETKKAINIFTGKTKPSKTDEGYEYYGDDE